MKIVYDTSVFISLLLFPSELTDKLNKITEQNELICPDAIVDETLDTLLKKITKFGRLGKSSFTLLDDFWNVFIELNGSIFLHQQSFNNIPVKIRDKKDAKILQNVIATNCDVFITGDKDFKVLSNINFKVLTISEFVTMYRNGD